MRGAKKVSLKIQEKGRGPKTQLSYRGFFVIFFLVILGTHWDQLVKELACYKFFPSSKLISPNYHFSDLRFSQGRYITIPVHFLGSLCSGDPGFYQNCGIHPPDTSLFQSDGVISYGGKRVLCSNYICKKDNPIFGTTIVSGSYELSRVHCNGNYGECANGDPDEAYCGDNSFFRCEGSGEPTKENIPMSRRCDGIQDCIGYEDEVGCNHTFGVECTGIDGWRVWADPFNMCDETHDAQHKPEAICKGDLDQGNSTACSNPVATCPSPDGKQRKVYPLQRCGTINPAKSKWLCTDATDQINCTNSKVWFKCTYPRTGHQVTLTDRVLCLGVTSLCTDNLTNKCESPETNCKVHRHYMCDGKADCPFALDESNCSDDFLAQLKCFRKIRTKTQPALSEELGDGWRGRL
eukprot:sb/3465248/